MTTKKKTIKIDVDGCIRDTFTAMCKVYERETGLKKTIEDIESYDTEVSFPAIKEIIENNDVDYKTSNEFFFEKHALDCFLRAKPIKNVKRAIDKFRAAGFRVAICTHQPHLKGRSYTLDFLTENDIHYDELHFTNEKWRIKADYIIDDSPEFLMDRRERAYRICIDYPFNRHLRHFSFAHKNRFKTVNDALEFIAAKHTNS